MANTVVTLRPDGVSVNNGGAWTTFGSPSPNTLDQATKDNLDSTGAQVGNFPPSGVTLSLYMGTTSIPALAQIRSVTPRIRASATSGLFTQTFLIRQSTGGGALGSANTYSSPVSPATFTGSPLTVRPSDGAAWTQADIDGLEFAHYSSNLDSGFYQIEEAYIDVAYNQAPVVSSVLIPAASGGIVNSTNAPAITWAYSDPESDPQERYRVKIFDAATIAGGGFNPETSTPVWNSGEVISAATTATPAPLSLGVTYTAYVKACDSGSSGRYGNWASSATFVITPAAGLMFDLPATPIVTATPDNTNNRFAIALQGIDNELTRNQSSVESGAQGWNALANVAATYPKQTLAAGQFLNGLAGLIIRSAAAGTMTIRSTSALTLASLIAEATLVTPGQVRTSLASFKSVSVAGRTATLTVTYYDAAAAQVGSPTTGAAITVLTASWVQASVQATVPANAVYEVVTITVLGAVAASEDIIVDQMDAGPGTSTTWTRGGFVQNRGNVLDTFTRADSAVTLGNSEGVGTPAWTSGVGTWGISSNKAYLVTAAATSGNIAYLTSQVLVDGVITTDLTLSAVRASAGVAFRGLDGTNFLLVRLTKTTVDLVELYKVVAGVYTQLGQFTPAGLVLGTTYGLKVEVYGGLVVVYLDKKDGNGYSKVLSVQMSASDLTIFSQFTNNKIGLFESYDASAAGYDNGGTRWDNFVAGNPKTQTISVERSLDAGVTWGALRSGTGLSLTDPGQTLTVYDYEVPPGTTPRYRAYVKGTEGTQPPIGTGVTVQSAYGTATASGPIVLTDWWLKDPLDPTKNTAIKVQGPISLRQKEPVQIYEPLGRNTSVYVTDGVKGISGNLQIWSKDKTTYDKIRALTMQGRVLQLQDPFNRSWYIKINGDQDWQMIMAAKLATESTPLRHFHQVSFGFDEVSAPAVT